MERCINYRCITNVCVVNSYFYIFEHFQKMEFGYRFPTLTVTESVILVTVDTRFLEKGRLDWDSETNWLMVVIFWLQLWLVCFGVSFERLTWSRSPCCTVWHVTVRNLWWMTVCLVYPLCLGSGPAQDLPLWIGLWQMWCEWWNLLKCM